MSTSPIDDAVSRALKPYKIGGVMAIAIIGILGAIVGFNPETIRHPIMEAMYPTEARIDRVEFYFLRSDDRRKRFLNAALGNSGKQEIFKHLKAAKHKGVTLEQNFPTIDKQEIHKRIWRAIGEAKNGEYKKLLKDDFMDALQTKYYARIHKLLEIGGADTKSLVSAVKKSGSIPIPVDIVMLAQEKFLRGKDQTKAYTKCGRELKHSEAQVIIAMPANHQASNLWWYRCPNVNFPNVTVAIREESGSRKILARRIPVVGIVKGKQLDEVVVRVTQRTGKTIGLNGYKKFEGKMRGLIEVDDVYFFEK